MLKRILYIFIAISWLVINQHNTINYYFITKAPVIEEIPGKLYANFVLYHDCDCGCGGDLSKCHCDDKASVFGMASCSVKVITVPVTPINLIANLSPFEEILSLASESSLPRLENENFYHQEVVFEIFHPPSQYLLNV